MPHDFEAKRRALEAEWERLDHSASNRSRQIEIEKELVKLNKEEARWKKLRAAAESISDKLLAP